MPSSSPLSRRAERTGSRARLLPILVEACVALADGGSARRAYEELASIADTFGTTGLRAAASTAAARVHLHEGTWSRAAISARAAAREWNQAGVVYERERSRELLETAYAASGESERARVEREAASPAPFGVAPTLLASVASGAAVERPRMASAPGIREGTTIEGKVDVGRLLGAGAMGVVYAGRHRITGRAVAIKVLQRALCADEAHCNRFLREALACGRVKHPHVVDVYDAGTLDGEPYIIMELLAGEPLSHRLMRQPSPSIDEALDIAEQIARGVAAAHEAGVVHRDLKPDNVFLCADARPLVKVLDFGISMLEDARHTRDGAVLGTPYYMSPEQVRDASAVDERTDVHAVGAILFEIIAGRPPYVGDSVGAVLLAIAGGPAPRLRALRADVPPSIADVGDRALARDPSERFSSASALADALASARASIG